MGTEIVVVMNQKGGVGKTTIVELCSEYDAVEKGKAVGVGDGDGQCNITDDLVGMDLTPNDIGAQLPPLHPDFDPDGIALERSSLADCFYGHGILPYSTWINEEFTKNKGFVDVFAGHPQKIEHFNAVFSNSKSKQEKYSEQAEYIDPKAHNILRDFLKGDDFQSTYDVIYIDLGPSRDPMSRAALRAASKVIIPFIPEKKSIQGINTMLQVIRQENYSRTNDMETLELIGLLPNKIRKNTGPHEANLKQLKEKHSDILFPEECWLSHLTAFPKRDMKDSKPKSIFHLPKSSTAKTQATAMAEYVHGKIFGAKK